MADSKYQEKGHIVSEDDSTDIVMAQNIQDSEILVHHEVKEGVEFSGQQGDEAIADTVTLKYGGEQEVEFHDTVSGEQETSHSTMSGEQEVESNAIVSGGQEVKSHSTVIGEQEIESHSIVSGVQFTTEGVHGETVYVEELQPDGNGISESECPPQDSEMEEVNQELKDKVDYDVDDDGDVFEAAQSGNIALLKNYLSLGLSPDVTDEEGCSILHHAASHGQVEVIKLLHERGCCIDPVDRHGRTPLHHAATSGGAAPIGVLVDLGSNVNYLDNEGNTPLKRAVLCENYSTLEELLKYGGVEDVECEQREEVSDEKGTKLKFIAELDDETVRDVLFQSSYLGDMQTLLAILDHGCPVDVADGRGHTALHRAAKGGHVEVIRELIARGVSANVQANDGYTPLHWAAAKGKLEAVHELLRMGGKASMTKVAGTFGTPLHWAAFGGHKKVMSVLLDEGCPIDVVSSSSRSVLHFAAEGGHVELFGWLVECGLDVNRGDTDGYTPLHSAAATGKLEAVQKLLRLGGKASMTKVAGIYGTPLHQAALGGHKNVMSVLLDENCPTDVVNSSGQSVLHFAAEGDHVELLGWLVECGLDVNRGDTDGYTPLHAAAATGKLEAMNELLRLGGKASMTKVAGTYGTPLHRAALGGHKKVMSVLLDEGCLIDVVSSSGQSILHSAVKGGHVKLLGWLIECGLDVNRGDADGCTSLHIAAHNGKLEAVHELLRLGGKASMTKVAGTCGTPLHQAALGGHKKVMSVLLDKGCPINVVSSRGRSVLHFAAQGGHVELLGWLVECGLDVNRGDADGYTPTHSATCNGKLEAVHELLRLGGKASMTKVAGTYGTPLHQAAFGGHKKVMSVLLDEGCPIDVVCSSGRSVLHVTAQGGHVELLGWLVECGLDANGTDSDGYTPLHWAAYNGKLEAVHELLRLGGKASMTKVAGIYGTPLYQAALGGHKKVMSVLLDEGCPIDVVNSSGRSILHFAAEGGHVELLGWLVECGLDVSRGDAAGYTPLHSAACEGKLEAVHELLRLGANPDVVAGVFGTPLHQAVCSGSVQVVTVLSEAIFERYNPQHLMVTEPEVDSSKLVCVPDNNPLDCCNSMGVTPLVWAAGEGHVEIVKFLISKQCNFTTQNSYGLSMFEVAVVCGQINKLHELCKACGFNDIGDSIRESILSLKNRNLFDPCKLLILGSFTGDPLVITTLSRDESMFTEAAHQTWSITNDVLCHYFPFQTVNIFQQLHLQDECPLSPLHISLIICKILMNYSFGNSIKRGAKDYKVFIDKLISHSSTKYTVNELFPNGLSPLDIARQFDFHDIASMIERAGGGPGLWANLPKQMEQKCIGAFLAVKELIDCDEAGKEATLRILSFLGYRLVGGEESSDANRIMGGRPNRSLIDKHVLSKLQHKDKWERVGNLLEVDEGELDRLGEESPSDDEAYYSMLKHWLKHGSQVTWKTLLDAIGYFETKKTVDDITDKIVEELASSQDKTQSTVMPSLKSKQLHVSSVAVSHSPYPVVCRPHPPLEPPSTVHVVQSTSSVKRSLQGGGFDSKAFMNKFSERFLHNVDSHAIVSRLEIKEVISEDVACDIDHCSVRKGNETLFLHLQKHADPDSISLLCEVMRSIAGYPKMSGLGRAMKEELDLLTSKCSWV